MIFINSLPCLKQILPELSFCYVMQILSILILSVVLATVTVALTLYFPILTGRAIDLILDKGNVDFPGILAIAKEGVIVIGITAAAQWIMNICKACISIAINYHGKEMAHGDMPVSIIVPCAMNITWPRKYLRNEASM